MILPSYEISQAENGALRGDNLIFSVSLSKRDVRGIKTVSLRSPSYLPSFDAPPCVIPREISRANEFTEDGKFA